MKFTGLYPALLFLACPSGPNPRERAAGPDRAVPSPRLAPPYVGVTTNGAVVPGLYTSGCAGAGAGGRKGSPQRTQIDAAVAQRAGVSDTQTGVWPGNNP